MEKTSKENSRPITANLIVAFGCISIGSLIGSFAYPLQKFEIWKQTEINQFNQQYSQVFILSDSDRQSPYGLDSTRAYKVASIYNDAKLQKLLLLAVAILSGSMALCISDDLIPVLEVQREVKKIDAEAKKQYLTDQIKHKWAMASQSQKLLFREELKELAALFGEDTIEATEINETDKFIDASYLLSEGHSIDYVVSQVWRVAQDSEEFKQLKNKLQKWLDSEDS